MASPTKITRPVIRVGGYAPPESVHSGALDHFADYVDRESNGEVDVAIRYNVLDGGGKATDLFDLLESGELTWMYYSSSYLGSKVPALNALEIPFLFGSLSDAHAALDGPFGGELADHVRKLAGYDVLGFWDNGFRHLTNRVRPIEHPRDAAGMRIRLQPNHIHEALARAWGMEPVAAELSAGIAMIKAGEVDAQENPLGNTFAYGVSHEHITLSAHLYGARGLFANSHEMAGLAPDVRSLVETGAREAINFQRSAAVEYERELRARFESEGRAVFEPDEAARAAFSDAANDVIERARAEIDPQLLELL
ncbi:MAG: TRAP transporter substrate-binding protein [Acidimicrobiales bacterium]